MPAGPQQDPQPELWENFARFREHVLSECERLDRPQPSDRQLENEYVHREVTKARAAAHAEVAVWEAQQGSWHKGVRTR